MKATPTEKSLNEIAFIEENALATSGPTAHLGLQLLEARRRMTWAAAWLRYARFNDTDPVLQEATVHLRRAQKALDQEAGR